MAMSKFKKAIERSNIIYHTQLSRHYDQTQPHFNKENVVQVKARLKGLARRCGAQRLLDIGCGTGFVLGIARPYFKELYGVDITPSMLNIAKKKFDRLEHRNIKLFFANSDALPFEDSHFNAVTAYGFLHHLPDLLPTFREAFRVLKKGGVLYADQDPNFYFWQGMQAIRHLKNISGPLKLERDSICALPKLVRGAKGIIMSARTIKMAEYQKTRGGFQEERVRALLGKAGFSKIHYEYCWFSQEGRVIRDLSLKSALYFEEHLRAALPLSRPLFKYVRIIAEKA